MSLVGSDFKSKRYQQLQIWHSLMFTAGNSHDQGLFQKAGLTKSSDAPREPQFQSS